MKTSKPFSTISWNSEDFLRVHLEDLVKRRKIYAWAYIKHLKEDDETKDHFHVLFFPNGQVDTDQVCDFFSEITFTEDGEMQDPINLAPPRSSKFGDWYLYCLHDVAYLASKDQTRRFHYTNKDMRVSNQDFFMEEVHQIDFSKYKRQQHIAERIMDGVTPSELVMDGVIPVPQLFAWNIFYDKVHGDSVKKETFRNGRDTHSPKVKDEYDF